MKTICVWPDNTWIEEEEYCELEDLWRGDDFKLVHVSNMWTDEQINNYLIQEN